MIPYNQYPPFAPAPAYDPIPETPEGAPIDDRDVLYPLISDFLEILTNKDTRRDYRPYIPSFSAKEYFTIDELDGMTSADMEKSFVMPEGTAKALKKALVTAIRDCRKSAIENS